MNTLFWTDGLRSGSKFWSSGCRNKYVCVHTAISPRHSMTKHDRSCKFCCCLKQIAVNPTTVHSSAEKIRVNPLKQSRISRTHFQQLAYENKHRCWLYFRGKYAHPVCSQKLEQSKMFVGLDRNLFVDQIRKEQCIGRPSDVVATSRASEPHLNRIDELMCTFLRHSLYHK